jgi:hypothetical protein
MDLWRTVAGRIGSVAALAMVLTGCAGVFPHRAPPPPAPPPVGYQIKPNGMVVAPPATPGVPSRYAASAEEATHPAVRIAASHRQYFDQRRAYFWEDGSPKT